MRVLPYHIWIFRFKSLTFLGFLYFLALCISGTLESTIKKVWHIMGHLRLVASSGVKSFVYVYINYKYQTKVVLLHSKIDILYHNYEAFLHNRKAYTIIPPIKYSLQLFLIFKSIWFNWIINVSIIIYSHVFTTP